MQRPPHRTFKMEVQILADVRRMQKQINDAIYAAGESSVVSSIEIDYYIVSNSGEIKQKSMILGKLIPPLWGLIDVIRIKFGRNYSFHAAPSISRLSNLELFKKINTTSTALIKTFVATIYPHVQSISSGNVEWKGKTPPKGEFRTLEVKLAPFDINAKFAKILTNRDYALEWYNGNMAIKQISKSAPAAQRAMKSTGLNLDDPNLQATIAKF